MFFLIKYMRIVYKFNAEFLQLVILFCQNKSYEYNTDLLLKTVKTVCFSS